MRPKICSGCKQAKPATTTFFGNDKRLKSGLHARCKDCLHETNRLWRETHSKQRAEQRHRYRLENLERYRVKDRAFAKSEAGRRKRAKDYAKHRERIIANAARWNRAHPKQRAAREAIRRGRIRAGGSYSIEEWEALKDLYGRRCLRCGRHESEVKLTPDHVLPIVRGGANTIDNIQPLCLSCNSSKGAKHIDYRGCE